MWSFLEPINVIRYLCVWRVNRALVRLPHYLSRDLSKVLGTIIAERLPTREARPWRKALKPQPTGGNAKNLSPAWPIESVLFTYPGKRYYGPGESIFWELKLMGPLADHGFFLEVILPAMEAASQTTDTRWYRSNTLWGRFDIQAIYVARGPQWEALVSDGRLDTRYRATPMQWAEGLSFEPPRPCRRLTWLTPVDLRNVTYTDPSETSPANEPPPTPTLALLLDGLLARIADLVPGKYTSSGDVWNMLSPDDQAALWDAVSEAHHLQPREQQSEKIPSGWPPGWLGQQIFAAISPPALPYLELASILHLGRQTHVGCGTFVL